jgi:hypothetical protein
MMESELIEKMEQLKALAEKATPRPYIYTMGVFKHYVSSENGDLGFGLQELHYLDGRAWATEATAKYIVAACNLAPALIAEIACLSAEVARLSDRSNPDIDTPAWDLREVTMQLDRMERRACKAEAACRAALANLSETERLTTGAELYRMLLDAIGGKE